MHFVDLLAKPLFGVYQNSLGATNIQVANNAGIGHCHFHLVFDLAFFYPMRNEHICDLLKRIFGVAVYCKIPSLMNIDIDFVIDKIFLLKLT